MRIAIALGLAALAAGTLTACNDGAAGTAVNTRTTPGTLIQNPPPRLASLSAADFTAQLGATSTGQQLLALALPSPTSTQLPCGVDFHYFQYQTVGGAGESTTASGALMVPTGGAGCSGPRPVLVYTHGTAVTRGYNIANIGDSTNEAWTESALIAAMYAANGYIVVASNYAGYDSSSLPYHPYLNADQQSQDVIYALTAARTALAGGLPAGDTDSGRLFITGYSQGGLVAMATHKAMQAAGMHVTASAPMSGPYAMEALFDAVILGDVGLGATVYGTMAIESYQHSYGNVFYLTGSSPDVFEATYATGIDSLLPGALSETQLFAQGKLPELALFSNAPTNLAPLDTLTASIVASNPVAALGFGPSNLIKNSVRVAYAGDAFTYPDHGLANIQAIAAGQAPPFADFVAAAPPSTATTFPLRDDVRRNDMRNWTPDGTAPILLCGGHDDPDVFFAANAQIMAGYWSGVATGFVGNWTFPNPPPQSVVTVLDVDPGQATSLGGIPSQIGTIAATVFGYDLAHGVTSAATLASDVQAAIAVGSVATGASPFAVYFTNGVPNSPWGVEVAGLAGVAAQAVATYYAQGVTSPATMGQDVTFAILAYFHFPITQTACEVAARAYFAAIP